MAKAFPLLAVEPGGKLVDNAPLMLHTRLAEMYRYAASVDDVEMVAELHNMRIAAKRLRYTMEIFASCFPGDDYTAAYESVKSIQEQIGDIHDCDVRVPLLQAFLDREGERRPEVKTGLDRAIRAELAKRGRLYLKFRKYWSKLQQQSFHRQFLELLIKGEVEAIDSTAPSPKRRASRSRKSAAAEATQP